MFNEITKIEMQKNNPNKVNIYINHEYSFSCALELVYKYKLEKGRKVDLEEFSFLYEDERYLNCKKEALKFIERTNKTEKELKDKLIFKGYDEETIYKVLKFMKNYDFIDDEKYTEYYIKDKKKQWGKNKIKYMLAQKGISELIVEDKLRIFLTMRKMKLFLI